MRRVYLWQLKFRLYLNTKKTAIGKPKSCICACVGVLFNTMCDTLQTPDPLSLYTQMAVGLVHFSQWLMFMYQLCIEAPVTRSTPLLKGF